MLKELLISVCTRVCVYVCVCVRTMVDLEKCTIGFKNVLHGGLLLLPCWMVIEAHAWTRAQRPRPFLHRAHTHADTHAQTHTHTQPHCQNTHIIKHQSLLSGVTVQSLVVASEAAHKTEFNGLASSIVQQNSTSECVL